MKKAITIAILLSVLIPFTSNAQESITIKQRFEQIKEKRENIKEKIELEKEKIEREKATTSIALKEKIKNNIEQKLGKKLDEKRLQIAVGFEEVVENLKNLLSRVEERITKIEEKNSVSSTTKDLVATAKDNILLAEEELNTFEAKLSATTSTNTKKVFLDDLKTQSEKTKEIIKTAHKTIVDIINSLKLNLETATSTPNDTYID
jgi:hypothetical protein